MAFLHEEFTKEQIEDLLRLGARVRARDEGHPVASPAKFIRSSEIVFSYDENGKILGAAVSWKDGG